MSQKQATAIGRPLGRPRPEVWETVWECRFGITGQARFRRGEGKDTTPSSQTKPAGRHRSWPVHQPWCVSWKTTSQSIDVQTEPGAFSEFIIVLPRVGTPLTKWRTLLNPLILVVDDEPDVDIVGSNFWRERAADRFKMEFVCSIRAISRFSVLRTLRMCH